jgi:sialate O-acetylesterase
MITGHGQSATPSVGARARRRYARGRIGDSNEIGGDRRPTTMVLLLLTAAMSAAAGPASPPVPLSLPPIFGSAMVLQRDMPVRLWGWCDCANVTVSFRGAVLTVARVVDSQWEVTLPPTAATSTPVSILISASDAASSQLNLTDVLVGDVFVCAGQSNMALPVDATYNMEAELREATAFGDKLRIMQIRPNWGATTPMSWARDNSGTRVGIGWSRVASATVHDFSAMCYYYGKQLRQARPDIAVGLVQSAFSGTALGPWVPNGTYTACVESAEPGNAKPGEDADDVVRLDPAEVRNPGQENFEQDHGHDLQQRTSSGGRGTGPCPSDPKKPKPSGCGGKTCPGGNQGTCPAGILYNGMVAPLLSLPIRAWLWYQGESDATAIDGTSGASIYATCFPAMIASWRRAWRQEHPAMMPDTPFLFVQLSAWPDGDRETARINNTLLHVG